MAKKNAMSIGKVAQTYQTSWRLVLLVWKTDAKLFSITIVATIIPGVIPFVNAYIYAQIINFIVSSITGTPQNITVLYWLIFFRIVSLFAQEMSFRTQDYIEQLLWTKVPIVLNDMLFSKIASLDMQYFEDSSFKDLLEKVHDSYTHRPQNLVSNILFMMQSSIQVVIALVAIAHLNIRLVLVVSIIVIPKFINQVRQSQSAWNIWGANSPIRKRFFYVANLLQDNQRIKEVKIFQLTHLFTKEIRQIQEKFYKDNKKLATKNYILDTSLNAFSMIIYVCIELFIIFEALAKRISIGDIGFYTSVVGNFQQGLSGFFRNVNNVFDGSLYVKSIFDLLDAKPLITYPQDTSPLNLQSAPEIEFRNVSFAYPNSSKNILHGFNLTINPGEKIAFVGENGAGKSTIIKLLARFYDVTEGEILIQGRNIKELNLQDWYQYVGILFQDFNRYEDTVKDNIYFGNIAGPNNPDDIKRAAQLGGADEIIERLNKGYNQMLGKTFEDGTELSTGQWQKIALSRAFFRNAPLLVLDEPTASIDAKAESEIFERVERLSKDKTVVIISHRFSTVRNADKIYVIDNGRIIESGTHPELMKRNKQYATLFNLQAKGYQ